MEKNLKDKIVVLTGAARNIGYEIARIFLKNEAKKVIILDVNDVGNEAVKTLNEDFGQNKAVFYKCDVTKDIESVIKKIIDNYKYVDVLVNSAGIVNELNARKTIEINLIGTVELSLKFWNNMRKDRGGRGGTIINISSVLGYRITPFYFVYNASKFGVMGFTRSLGHEQNYKKTGVRVMAICPGWTRTDLLLESVVDPDDTDLDEAMQNTDLPVQDAEAVGRAALDVFVKGDSGTAWLSEGGKPVVKVVQNYTE